MDKIKEYLFTKCFCEVYNELTEEAKYEPYSVFLSSICTTIAQFSPEDRADFFEQIKDIKDVLKDCVFEDYEDFHSFLISSAKELDSS